MTVCNMQGSEHKWKHKIHKSNNKKLNSYQQRSNDWSSNDPSADCKGTCFLFVLQLGLWINFPQGLSYVQLHMIFEEETWFKDSGIPTILENKTKLLGTLVL